MIVDKKSQKEALEYFNNLSLNEKVDFATNLLLDIFPENAFIFFLFQKIENDFIKVERTTNIKKKKEFSELIEMCIDYENKNNTYQIKLKDRINVLRKNLESNSNYYSKEINNCNNEIINLKRKIRDLKQENKNNIYFSSKKINELEKQLKQKSNCNKMYREMIKKYVSFEDKEIFYNNYGLKKK